MNTSEPLISVVMPVYNAEAYVRLAIESVLAQTEAGFELIVIDDGSTDQTRSIICGFSDRRIVLIRNEKNLGIPRSLNKGLAIARGKFIARMDGDDISASARFKKQAAYMEANPDVAACGAWAIDIDENGAFRGEHRAPTGSDLKIYRLLPSPLIHPSVMMRRDIVEKLRYDENESQAEDYDLWLRLQREHRIDNLPEFLLQYRVHKHSRTTLEGELQFSHSHRLFCRHVFEVSFELFSAMMFRSYAVPPLTRWHAMRQLAYHSEVASLRYLVNHTMYVLKWGFHNLKKRLSRQEGDCDIVLNTASKTPGQDNSTSVPTFSHDVGIETELVFSRNSPYYLSNESSVPARFDEKPRCRG